MRSFICLIIFTLVYQSVSNAESDSLTKLKKTSLTKLYSETEAGNILPQFLFMQGAIEGGAIGVKIGGGKGDPIPFEPDDTCGDDIFEGANPDLRSPQLPYLTQDLWGCEREEKSFDAYTLENNDLIVTVTPQWAGKVWSIYDKHRKKDILYNNRAHQPANIGALKAWAAGGAEWNWSPGIIGHSAFSESQTYLAEIDTVYGKALRVYEYDRYNSTVWQVDMIVINDTFYAHPTITNPNDKDLRGYWWTCVAVESTPTTRILTPASNVAETSRDGARNALWPIYSEAMENASFVGTGEFQSDMSYIGNHQLGDMFLRIPSNQVYTPYIGHTDTSDPTGYTLIHGHSLNGTKFFTWGQSGPGRFMQDFLAGGRDTPDLESDKHNHIDNNKKEYRVGDYTELQVGPAPTQMQTFHLEKNSQMSWTEWFKGFNGNPSLLADSDYSVTLDHVDQWMKSDQGLAKTIVNDVDKFLNELSKKPVDTKDILVSGSAWGALEEMRINGNNNPNNDYHFNNALKFELPTDTSTIEYLEIQPWLQLLQKGTFESDILQLIPLSYQTTDAWMDLIYTSGDKYQMTWLHYLHLGIGSTERGNSQLPLELLHKSISLQPTAIGYRCIAVLQSDDNQAWEYYQLAYKNLFDSNSLYNSEKNSNALYRTTRNLIVEICNFLQERQWYSTLDAFLHTVPIEHTDLDLYLSSKVHTLLYKGKTSSSSSSLSVALEYYEEAITLLKKHCFATYAGARDDLMAMWNDAVIGRETILQNKVNEGLSPVEKHKTRMKYMIPDNIGCKYATEYCINYW